MQTPSTPALSESSPLNVAEQSVAKPNNKSPTQHGYPESTQTPQSPVSDDKDESLCIICTEPLEEPVQLNPCNHTEFCAPCLLNWATTQASACPPKPLLCPLCANPVASATHLPSATDLDLPDPDSVVKREPERITSSDLLSLDHTYFLAEVERMLGEVEDARRQRRLSGASVGKRSSIWESANDALLTDASVILGTFRGALIDTAPFDAVILLGRLTAVQDALKVVWAGPDAHASSFEDPSMALVLSAAELGDPFDPMTPLPVDHPGVQSSSSDSAVQHGDSEAEHGEEEPEADSWSSSSPLRYSDDFVLSRASSSKSSSARKKARKARKSAAKARRQSSTDELATV